LPTNHPPGAPTSPLSPVSNSARYGWTARCAVLPIASATALAGAMCETYVAVVASEEWPRSCWMTGKDVPLST